MKKLAVLAVALLLIPSLVSAQSVDSYTFRAYAVGGQAPIQTPFVFLANAVVCNQDPPSTLNTVNPTRFAWDDAILPGRVCIWTDPGNGPLFSTPISTTLGNYEGTLTSSGPGGTSGESNRAPFSRAPVLAAPSSFRIYR